MKLYNWSLVLIGIGAVAALLLWQLGETQSHHLTAWLAGAVLLALAYTVLQQLHAGARAMAELRRISVATANVMAKTSERVVETRRQAAQTHRMIEAAGERLETMHDQQLAIYATLRSRYPLGAAPRSTTPDDAPLSPEHSGEFSAYGRTLAKTMQARPLHQRPRAFEGERDDDATSVMARPQELCSSNTSTAES